MTPTPIAPALVLTQCPFILERMQNVLLDLANRERAAARIEKNPNQSLLERATRARALDAADYSVAHNPTTPEY